MNTRSIAEWATIVIDSTIRRQTSLIANTLLCLWIAVASWFVLPHFLDGAFVPACDSILLWIITGITASLGFLAYHSDRYSGAPPNVEHFDATLTGTEIQAKFRSLPLHFAGTLDPHSKYPVSYLTVSHTDLDGDLHERHYALHVGDWEDSRPDIRFPAWVRLLPPILTFPVFLGALLDRTREQFLDVSLSQACLTFLHAILRQGVQTILQAPLDWSALFPGSFLAGSAAYAAYLVHFIRKIREAPTHHAVQ